MKQNAGVSNIEITKDNIKAFESTAKKYGIDFALKKDSTEIPPVSYTHLDVYKRQGEKLPSENELSQKYSLSRHTVRKALGILEQDGYVAVSYTHLPSG